MSRVLIAGRIIPPEECPIDVTSMTEDAVRGAGDTPVVSLDLDEVDKADIVIIPGDLPDVDPAYYGEEIEEGAGTAVNRELDEIQMAIIDRAVNLKKPMFALCRGYQLVAVYFGATLIQDIAYGELHNTVFEGDLREHDVYNIPGTFMQELYGDKISTNTGHHQAIKQMPECLGISQIWVAPGYNGESYVQDILDGRRTFGSDECCIEAIYHKSLPIYGLQWHPEISKAFGAESYKRILTYIKKVANIMD